MSYVPFQQYKELALKMAGYLSVRIRDSETPNVNTDNRIIHKMTVEGDPMTSIQSARIEAYLTYSKALLIERKASLDDYVLVTTDAMYHKRSEFWFSRLPEDLSRYEGVDVFGDRWYALSNSAIFYIKRGEPQFLVDLPMPFLEAVKPGLTTFDADCSPPSGAVPAFGS